MRRWLVGLVLGISLACAGPDPEGTAGDGLCRPSTVQITLGGQQFEGLPALVAAGKRGSLPGDPPPSGFERVEFDEVTPLPCALDLNAVQFDNAIDYLGLSWSGSHLVVVDGTSALRSLRVFALPTLDQVYSAGLEKTETLRRDGDQFTFVVVTDKKAPCTDPSLEANGMSCYELREVTLGPDGQAVEGAARGVAVTE